MSFSALKCGVNLSKSLLNKKNLLASSILKAAHLKNPQAFSRSYVQFSRNGLASPISFAMRKLSLSKTCTCEGSTQSQKGDEELVAFLAEEIENEKRAQVTDNLPALEGFECSLNGAEVELTKKMNNETIKIKANVNGSVDAEPEILDPNDKEHEAENMKSKPSFTVEIHKGKKILYFSCNYVVNDDEHADPESQNYNDVFEITELSLHEGELNDSTYMVSGEIMDGYLYDLLMNYLEERGISNDFVDKLTVFFTSYEHKLYINLLQGAKKFIEK